MRHTSSIVYGFFTAFAGLAIVAVTLVTLLLPLCGIVPLLQSWLAVIVAMPLCSAATGFIIGLIGFAVGR